MAGPRCLLTSLVTPINRRKELTAAKLPSDLHMGAVAHTCPHTCTHADMHT